MSRLWIFIEDRYVRYELNHDFIYESLKVHIADCVFVNDVCLDSGECKTIDRYLVYLDASKLCWKCMEVHDVFSIGRDLSNTYVCSDLRVSSFHARIQNGVIEDISSLNGTYVNQKKISSYVLDVGDEILIGFEWFIYLNSYILVHSVEMDLDDISYAVLHTSDYQKNYQNIISPSIFHYDLDLPLTMARVSKSHILNAIGPSFMILVSGLISLLLSSFIAETSVVFSSFLSSLSMAVVFGGYGLWNRAYQYKQGILENKNLEKKYVKYLERIEQQMVSDKCTYSKQFMQYLEWALHSYHCMSEFTFYCGDVLKNWSSFNERAISYDRYEEELVVLRQSLMEKYFDVISHPYFLKKNDVVWIHCSLSDFYTLFEYWTWYCDSGIKWAWLGDFKGVERVLLDVHCQSDGKFLYSEDEMSLLSMINEPVVLVTNQVNGLNGKYEAVIYIGQEKPVYPCISVIPKSLPSFDIDKRRFVQSQYAMHDDYFFRDLISHGVIRSSCFVSRIVVGHDASYLPYKMDFIEDGPHGLVAGTTGSGKSEWLSFILMMMIWHNSPFDFQYILIDFKGGSFGQSLYSFAHCAGMITNLDKKEMNRFFLSMQREVEKRQEILFKQKVSDIHDLDCEHRLSRLWIVVDEFAQLKMSYPEMMKQLQELARIGRSLGIHLILSTQKPSGFHCTSTSASRASHQDTQR